VLGVNWSWDKKMEPIRVYVIDDHPMIRHGVAAMLAGEPGIVCVGGATDGAEALRNAPALRPDVVLVDLVMPRMDGVAAIAALRPLLPAARFVVLSGARDADEVARALAAGASGQLLKNATTLEVVAAVHGAHRSVHAQVQAPEVDDAQVSVEQKATPGADLTQRERELLALMARGLSNLEIASALAIAMPTVKFHVTNILAKLHADNRTEAVLVALRQKIVRLD
jgi:two-component system, NarL family, response regulator LiaR